MLERIASALLAQQASIMEANNADVAEAQVRLWGGVRAQQAGIIEANNADVAETQVRLWGGVRGRGQLS